MPNLVWHILSNVKGLGNKTLISLYRACPTLSLESIEDNFNLIKSIIKKKVILEQITNTAFLKDEQNKVSKEIELHNNQGIKMIPINNEYYPKLLLEIENPPIILYAKGNIELLKNSACIAIIGTREPTKIGLLAAKKIARLFANNKYTIVSGLAKGIDTAGHLGALEATNGKTIAVLASGLDSIYPKENTLLAEQIIASGGLLVSEYPINARPFKSAFVNRDRIQSGLSLAVCPVQTPIEGGTQHTIRFTKLQNRLLFCPYPQEPESVTATQGIYELIHYNKALVINDSDDYLKIITEIKNKASEYNVIVPNDFINYSDKKIPKELSEELDLVLKKILDHNVPQENVISYVKKIYS